MSPPKLLGKLNSSRKTYGFGKSTWSTCPKQALKTCPDVARISKLTRVAWKATKKTNPGNFFRFRFRLLRPWVAQIHESFERRGGCRRNYRQLFFGPGKHRSTQTDSFASAESCDQEGFCSHLGTTTEVRWGNGQGSGPDHRFGTSPGISQISSCWPRQVQKSLQNCHKSICCFSSGTDHQNAFLFSKAQ